MSTMISKWHDLKALDYLSFLEIKRLGSICIAMFLFTKAIEGIYLSLMYCKNLLWIGPCILRRLRLSNLISCRSILLAVFPRKLVWSNPCVSIRVVVPDLLSVLATDLVSISFIDIFLFTYGLFTSGLLAPPFFFYITEFSSAQHLFPMF